MLPILFKYRGKYILGLWMVVALVSLLLSFAFTRNANDPEKAQIFSFCLVLAGGISFTTLRDAFGFWTYCTVVKKFHLTYGEEKKMRSYQKSVLKRAASRFLLRPAVGAILITSTLLLALFLARRFIETDKSLVFVAVVGIGLPTLLSAYVFFLVPAFIALADSIFRNGNHIKSYQVRNRIRICTIGDLAMTLGINLTVVLPLSSHPDFSLANGYFSLDFLIAALIMMWIVTFFTLQGANRSRLFSAAGEVLCGSVKADVRPDGREDTSASSEKGPGDALLIFIGVSLWVLLVAGVFSTAPHPPHFWWFYAVLITPLMVLFLFKRRARLVNDYAQARLLEIEMPEFAITHDS
ncbi:hypothetical protein [Desulfatitalea alkaliphila]|uniref:Uncharacterized protein n=1 Tax=Desulfatitalea alkaliphila TaxID=2929485 RepID=A0AA41R8L9_9BACT|nr:hypothetical protein [Desulfatitalea alkaliphila]MCJ8503035.1 hypothetical protein [Desulfatitalea alkaliphila]